MKIAILGFGTQGQSAYEYWHSGNDITICDKEQPDSLPNDVVLQTGENHLQNLHSFDLIVRSPSVHPRDIVSANSSEILEKVTTNTNEFFKACPTKNIIGVTGTKGKGTTSTLIAKMLEAAGKRVHLGGNIGIPPLELLKNNIQADDWVVLELANFQLIDLKYSPHIAVCLMVVPEHQDWHADAEEYYAAKSQLFAHQTSDDAAVYFAENEVSKRIASVGEGRKIPYFTEPGATVDNGVISISGQEVCRTNELRLLGKHNWQNACAAVTAVWQITQDIAAIRTPLVTFSGLEHRLEFVKEVNGVKYYDDSFGTTPETAIVAIQAFEQPKIVILGGSDKGASYDELAQTVAAQNVKHVIAIGDTAQDISSALKAKGYTNITLGLATMPEIVRAASEHAESGDIVLLSTGSASFGLFQNYKDRGEQFKRAVQALG